MGRNEIRLRRHQMSSGRIARHRNYGDVMARHERDLKLRRVMKVFFYFLIIAVLVILFFIVRGLEERGDKPGNTSFKPTVETVGSG